MHGRSDDGHSQYNVQFAASGHSDEDKFLEQNHVADYLLGKIVYQKNRRVFEKNEKFVFKRDPPFTDVVRFMV